MRVGDKVICIDQSGTMGIDKRQIYTIDVFYGDSLLSLKEETEYKHYFCDRFKLAPKNNKLNRKLYPNHKVEGNYLVEEINE